MIEFLGYRFFLGKKYPRKKSLASIQDRIRKHTKRTNAHSLEKIIAILKPIQRGWFEYYKHCHPTVFSDIDGWTRHRLRSILKKREKRQGMSTMQDNVRYPNKIFDKAGFFSLVRARQELCQPLK